VKLAESACLDMMLLVQTEPAYAHDGGVMWAESIYTGKTMIPDYGKVMVVSVVERPNLATLLQFLASMFEIVCQAEPESAVAMEACMASENFPGETFPGSSPNDSVGSSEGSSILDPEQD
jgi:hypothetical protein